MPESITDQNKNTTFCFNSIFHGNFFLNELAIFQQILLIQEQKRPGLKSNKASLSEAQGNCVSST